MNLKKLFSAIALLLISTSAFSQMNSWAMPPFRFDVTVSPVTMNPLYSGAPSSGSYFVSNGAYDVNGNLLFFVQDNYVYGSNGVLAGQLGMYPGYPYMSGEIAIVPVPGECKKFYVIYGRAYGPMTGAVVLDVIVDCTSGSPQVIYSSGNNAFLVQNTGGNGNCIAVSKKNGSGANAIYYLYTVNSSGFVSYSIVSSSGVGGGGPIGYTSPVGSCGTEMELSENGKWLAFNNSLGSVTVIQLSTPTTYQAGSQQIYTYQSGVYNTYGRIRGLEFVGSNTPDLYVAGLNTPNAQPIIPIFDKINVSTQTKTPVMIAPYTFTNTFLEYSKSGKVCGISEYNGNRYFIEYNVTNQSFNTTQINNLNPNSNTTSMSSIQYSNVYTLPDQIDGEDYTNFTTNPVVTLSGMTVNGLYAPFNGCNGVFQEVYNCNPINVSAGFEGGTPCYMQLGIYAVDQYCNSLLGSDFFNYEAVVPQVCYASGALQNYDLKKHYRDYNQSLNTMPGYYILALTILDCCGHESTLYFPIRVLQAISPTINLETYDYNNPQTYLAYSHNINLPNTVGASSIGFRVSGSTGNVTSMNVVVDKVDNTGAYMGNILNETKAVTNLSGLTYESLNGYCVPQSVWGMTPPTTSCNVNVPAIYNGYKSYFIYNNNAIVGNNYKLTVTLSNACSSSTEWTYMNVNNAYARMAGPGQDENAINSAQVFPNPVSNEMTIKINNVNPDNYSVSLYDLDGRLLKVTSSVNLEAGEQTITVDTSDLENGIYIWKINSGTLNKNGTVSIVK